MMGFGGVERVTDRILEELEAARGRGEQQLVVSYTQSEIGIRANATQMAVFIRRKIEKRGFEIIDGTGGEFGGDVRLLVSCKLPRATPRSGQGSPEANNDPDLEQLNRALQAISDAPPAGSEGADMSGADIAEIQAWMGDRFAAGDYEATWHRRLALGYGLSGDGVETETWFWVNAFPALSALRLGEKDHPFVATSAGFADEAYRKLSEQSSPVQKAMSEINDRFFGN